MDQILTSGASDLFTVFPFGMFWGLPVPISKCIQSVPVSWYAWEMIAAGWTYLPDRPHTLHMSICGVSRRTGLGVRSYAVRSSRDHARPVYVPTVTLVRHHLVPLRVYSKTAA